MALTLHHIPVSVPTGGYEVRMSLTFTGGFVLNGSDEPYTDYVIPAGYHPLHWYASRVDDLIRDWAEAAGDADPDVNNPGNPEDVGFTIAPSLSETAGGSRFVLVFNPNNFTPSALTAASIDNTTGWATPFGFEHGASAIAATINGGVAIWTGAFSPRGIFPLPSVEDPGFDRLVRANYFAHVAADGTVLPYDSGSSYSVRTYRVNQLSAAFGGPRRPIGYYASISGDRKTITVATASQFGTVDGFGAILYRSDLAAAHNWIAVEGVDYAARAKTVGASTIVLYEPLPSDPAAGAEIYILSEADVLDREAVRVNGYHLIHASNDEAGTPLWGAFSCYARAGKGESTQPLERPGSDPLFSWQWELLRRSKTGLTLP